MVNDIFRALADPTRREILKFLKKSDLTAGEITDRFTLSGASISHHLAILKNAGLVLGEKKGQFVTYSINMSVFQEFLEWIYEFRGDNK